MMPPHHPILSAIDRLTALELERQSWLSPASEQIRRWRKEDEAKGLFWNTQGGRVAQEAPAGNSND